MKTKKDILHILRSNPADWCREGLKQAIKYLRPYDDDATLVEIAGDISSGWAYRWAMDIGDVEVMRDRVTTSG